MCIIYINIHITILSSGWSFPKTYVCWMLLLHDNHANWSSSFSRKSGNVAMFRRPLTGHRKNITGISPVSKPSTHFFRIVTSHSSGFQTSGWLGTGHHVFSYQEILVHLKGLTCTFPITHQEIRKCLGVENITLIYDCPNQVTQWNPNPARHFSPNWSSIRCGEGVLNPKAT